MTKPPRYLGKLDRDDFLRELALYAFNTIGAQLARDLELLIEDLDRQEQYREARLRRTRGRSPQGDAMKSPANKRKDWDEIHSRHLAGETFASIGADKGLTRQRVAVIFWSAEYTRRRRERELASE